MADDARLHHNAPAGLTGDCRRKRARRPRPNVERPIAAARLPEALSPGMPGLLRGPHDLADEALRPWRRGCRADAARPDAQIVVAHAHGARRPQSVEADGARDALNSLRQCCESASTRHDRHGQIAQPNQPMASTDGGRFYLAVRGSVSPLLPLPHHQNMR